MLKNTILLLIFLFSWPILCKVKALQINSEEIDGIYIGKNIQYLSEKNLFEKISSTWNVSQSIKEKIKSGHLGSDRDFDVRIDDIPGGYRARVLDKASGNRGLVEWCVRDLLKPEVDSLFKQSEKEILSINFMPHSYWLNFSINNKQDEEQRVYLELDKYMFNLAHLFYYDDENDLIEKRIYFNTPLLEREVKSSNFVFPIELHKGENIFYMRIDNWFMDTVPLRLWSERSFYENRINSNTIQGILTGIYLLIIVYSLSIFFAMNDFSYLYLGLTAACSFLIHIATSGFGFIYLWPQSTQTGILLFYTAFPLSIIFTILFCRHFVQTRQYTPSIDRYMNALIILLLAVLVLLFITPFNVQKNLFLFIYATDHLYYWPFIFSAFIAVKRKNNYGYFLLLALFFFILAQAEWILTNLNIIPYSLVYYLNIKGIAFAAIMMTGLVYKFKVMSNIILDYKLKLDKATNRINTKTITDAAKLKIEQVKEFLKVNFCEDISREGLASAAEMSPDHLGRIFKKETGIRISEYINKLRIEKAKELLKAQETKIIDIAFDVGFESLRTFNKVFHETEGKTPSEYRKDLFI